jgi:hypothetical protein
VAIGRRQFCGESDNNKTRTKSSKLEALFGGGVVACMAAANNANA